MYFQSGHLSQVGKTALTLKKSYEMGYTIDEFDKTLHGQFITKQSAYTCSAINAKQWEVNFNDKTLQSAKIIIEIAPLPPRIIAMLRLPVLNVSFDFMGLDNEQQSQFLNRFFKYFHKGGG
ncbi:MAG: hypothetical protein V3V19_07645 [Cocleimonas sp.]